MNYKKLMDTAMLAGEVMMKSGAETYRVEDTMHRILRSANVQKTEAFAITTGIFATLDDPAIDSITMIRRISERGINLNNISQVNQISRDYCDGRLNLDEAYDSLKGIRQHEYKHWFVNLNIVLLIGSFALVLGGSLLDMALSTIVGIVLIIAMEIEKKYIFSSFIRNVLSSTCIAIVAVWLHRIYPASHQDIITIAGIIPMVPGTAITNAIRDTLQGDYMSGGAKALEAFVIAASIAIGVAFGLLLLGGIQL